MKKYILPAIVLCIIAITFGQSALAQGLVPCSGQCCTICSFFQMLVNIYNFIIKVIAVPLAGLIIVIGAVFMIFGAGNPKFFTTGKTMIVSAIIGLVLVFCSWLIINTVLTTLGYHNNWYTLELSCEPPPGCK